MIGTIAITDEGWYQFLRDRPEVTELNFWTPSARRTFRAPQFSPFIFKLRSPYNAVCGFAYFAQFSRLPDWLAWDSFGFGNGCASFEEMHQRIARIRERIRYDQAAGSDEIGCIQLVAPTFFSPDSWIPQPNDWHPRNQTPVKYDLTVSEGQRVCIAQAISVTKAEPTEEAPLLQVQPRYGDPRLVRPRLGQNTFRIAVLDAYNRGCAVTHEHSLPALEASHIRPFAQNGPHEIRNGLLLRADLHRLFDKGYVTVTPEYRLEVSSRLQADYHNGRTYYPLHGTQLQIPVTSSNWPDREYLEWHNEHVYRG